jgi:hypothetical protein
LFSKGFRYNKALIFNLKKKGTRGPVNSLVYNLPLLIFLAKRLVINTEDVNYCLDFRVEWRRVRLNFCTLARFYYCFAPIITLLYVRAKPLHIRHPAALLTLTSPRPHPPSLAFIMLSPLSHLYSPIRLKVCLSLVAQLLITLTSSKKDFGEL